MKKEAPEGQTRDFQCDDEGQKEDSLAESPPNNREHTSQTRGVAV